MNSKKLGHSILKNLRLLSNPKILVVRALLKLGIQISRCKDSFNIALYEKLYSKSVLSKRPFYNIGSGTFYHPYWTNIDYVSDWYAPCQKNVINHNLMSGEPLPIETKSAKILYTSHTIEHISDRAVQVLFREAHRVLEDSGIFRITTGPDAETDYRALANNDKDWFYWDEMYEKKGTYEHIFTVPPTSVSLAERWLHHAVSQLSIIDISPSAIKLKEKDILDAIKKYGFPDVLDYFCSLVKFNPDRPGNHISWWTHDKIFEFLSEAGFTKIYRSGFNQSVSPLMRHSSLFDSTHPQMSIYVEAVKS